MAGAGPHANYPSRKMYAFFSAAAIDQTQFPSPSSQSCERAALILLASLSLFTNIIILSFISDFWPVFHIKGQAAAATRDLKHLKLHLNPPTKSHLPCTALASVTRHLRRTPELPFRSPTTIHQPILQTAAYIFSIQFCRLISLSVNTPIRQQYPILARSSSSLSALSTSDPRRRHSVPNPAQHERHSSRAHRTT